MHDLDLMNYIPESGKEYIRSRAVSIVHFVACAVLDNGGNHWNISLQTSKDQSIRLDMSPSALPGSGGYLGRLDVILQPYAIMRHNHMALSIPMDYQHNVAKFLDAIVQDNYRYEFRPGGRGCGGWIRDQLSLFMSAGLLPSMVGKPSLRK
ncbi:hypothetical protein HJFPF1_08671 [Paramyrothecium foliicola]|nr:hypothetical protein HJFPF1_08671 [Paramyrothecium foliicola]